MIAGCAGGTREALGAASSAAELDAGADCWACCWGAWVREGPAGVDEYWVAAVNCLVDAGGREEELEPDAAAAWVAGGVAKPLEG